MERTPVSSSNIAAVGYDEPTKTLEVEFNSGLVYQYDSVPISIYESMISASSVGVFFHENVKGQFDYVQTS